MSERPLDHWEGLQSSTPSFSQSLTSISGGKLICYCENYTGMHQTIYVICIDSDSLAILPGSWKPKLRWTRMDTMSFGRIQKWPGRELAASPVQRQPLSKLHSPYPGQGPAPLLHPVMGPKLLKGKWGWRKHRLQTLALKRKLSPRKALLGLMALRWLSDIINENWPQFICPH